MKAYFTLPRCYSKHTRVISVLLNKSTRAELEDTECYQGPLRKHLGVCVYHTSRSRPVKVARIVSESRSHGSRENSPVGHKNSPFSIRATRVFLVTASSRQARLATFQFSGFRVERYTKL